MAIVNKVTSGMNKIITSRPINKVLEAGLKDPAGTAAKMMVLSFISKDAVNCAIYTYQSLNNEKIPEDKRGFVAALDLIQGFINVGGQFLAFYIFDRALTPKWFGKLYSGTLKDKNKKIGPLPGKNDADKSLLLDDNIRGAVKDILGQNAGKVQNKRLITRINRAVQKAGLDISKIKPDEVENVIVKLTEDLAKDSKKFASVEKGFGLLVGALATNALVKRTLSPLIATPLAGKLSENWDKKRKAAQDRMDYEVQAVAQGKFDYSKMDKTVFKSMSSGPNSK